MLKRIDIVKLVSLIMWGSAIVAYFFQFPFSKLSSLIIPCLAVYMFCQVKKIKFCEKSLFLLIVFLFYVTASAAMSWLGGSALTRIIRFAVILLAIVFCSFIRDCDFKKEADIFINLAILKSMLVISIAVTIILLGRFDIFRAWAFENNLGDIYFLNKFFPRVQVQGNALLVVAAILEYMRSNKVTIKLMVILLGVLFAGNFAYVIGLGVFVIYICIKKLLPVVHAEQNVVKASVVLIIIAYIIVMPYLLGKIEEKSEVSNKTRIEQAEVLLNTNLVIGDGLGNYIKASTSTREYDGDIYFELQTLYILNQIGIVGLCLFYMILFINLRKRGKEIIIIYLIYLVYTFWNPYCFDTTQIIATLLIINMSEMRDENEECNRYSILSKSQAC